MRGLPKVLLTGATGFVGRQILRALEERGVPVRILVRKPPPDDFPLHPSTELVETADLFAMSRPEMTAVLADIATVIHSAWYCEPGKYLQSPLNLHCLNGTLRLAEACAEAGNHRFVGIGTLFEYDMNAGRLALDTPLKPTSLYAAAKLATFSTLSRYFSERALSFAWCRLFHMYGEHEDPRRLIASIRSRLAAGQPVEIGNGHLVRDYLDVRATGEIIARVALSDFHGPFNVCSGKAITIRRLAERIATELDRNELLSFGPRRENLSEPDVVVGEPTPLPDSPLAAIRTGNERSPANVRREEQGPRCRGR